LIGVPDACNFEYGAVGQSAFGFVHHHHIVIARDAIA
jgi:hypothetical protein